MREGPDGYGDICRPDLDHITPVSFLRLILTLSTNSCCSGNMLSSNDWILMRSKLLLKEAF